MTAMMPGDVLCVLKKAWQTDRAAFRFSVYTSKTDFTQVNLSVPPLKKVVNTPGRCSPSRRMTVGNVRPGLSAFFTPLVVTVRHLEDKQHLYEKYYIIVSECLGLSKLIHHTYGQFLYPTERLSREKLHGSWPIAEIRWFPVTKIDFQMNQSS